MDCLPTNWKKLKLSKVLKVKHGKNQKQVECDDGKYPILGSGGLMGYANDYIWDKPSVLIGRKGTINKPQFMNKPFWTVDTLFYTDIFEGYEPKWLYYVFQTINWYKYNEASGVPSLSASTIEKIKIIVPPFEEQKEIANILSTWDVAIDLREKELKMEKSLLIQAINTLTKNNDFIDVKYNPISIDECTSFVNGYSFQSKSYEDVGDYNIVTIGNVQDGKLDLHSKTKKISRLPNNISKHQILSKEDILISMTGNVGRVCKVNESNLLLNQRVGKFIIKPVIHRDYFYYSLRSTRFLSKMIAKAQGGAQPNLSTKDIKNYYIEIPEYKRQAIIGRYLSSLDKKIELLIDEITQMKIQKKGLMQQLLTGKIRVQS
ncbi:restriction endonuclease subunit S [Mariniplasma anaerobium]|uniref:Type I restriction modification DNA specificity domain-containing protein n=1 Tax=Mariniplasma anaerobium TaxID=2735436 RepID=A0A7R7V665_9MOLU|nr:restriction endonuclease subunit S [Mariniplasma anaerobium]BCR35177.1 hypothetical protein MPAN_000700 [Mariniplasma anaerobium]